MVHVFKEKLMNSNYQKISFPEPLLDLCSPSVLVETFEEGTLMTEMMNESKERRHQLAMLGLHAILKMVFIDNYIHAGAFSFLSFHFFSFY